MNASECKDELINVRVALLKYYNSQCMQHGAYIISLIVGASVLISRWNAFTPNLLTFLIFSAIINGIIIILVYAIGRSFFWRSLITLVMQINLNNFGEEEKKLVQDYKDKKLPCIFILHTLTKKRAVKPIFCRVFGRPKRLYIPLFLIFVIDFLIVDIVYLLFQA